VRRGELLRELRRVVAIVHDETAYLSAAEVNVQVEHHLLAGVA
jgi:hypothetical protein